MSKRRKLILIILIILILILLATGLFFVFFKKIPLTQKFIPKKEPEEELPIKPAPEETLSKKEDLQLKLKELASFFAERFGSFSNQAPLENLIELKPFMSRKMQIWTEELSKKPSKRVEIYHGFTTKALSSEILDIQEEVAKILVQTQRQEATKTTDNIRVFYQEIEMELIKESEEWKINEARWK